MADSLSIANLIADWLHQEFPNNFVSVEPPKPEGPASTIKEVMVDGVGVAEIFESQYLGKYNLSLSLFSPDKSETTNVAIANPESLPLLTKCVNEHLDSKTWSHIMKANREMTGLAIAHRSSLGYRRIFV